MDYIEVIELEHCRKVAGRRCRVNGPFITVFVQERNKCTMVQVSVRQYHGIKLGKRMNLGNIEVRSPVRVVWFFPAVDQYTAVGSRK